MATAGLSWRDLCQEVSHEQDPRKLLELLREINHALVQLHVNAAEAQLHA